MIQAKHLPELAEKALQVQGERRTFWMMGEFVTNVQIADRARRFKRALEEHGIGKGDIACMCIVNNPFVYSIFGGIFRTGATAVPVMFQLSAKELNYIFGHTEAKCIITDMLLIDKVREAVKDLPHVEWIGVLGGQDDESTTPREYRLDSFFEREPDPAIPAIESDDVAIMLYTSGTTGRPKGVMLSHANLLASAKAANLAGELHAREHPIISINALPMAHIFGVGVMNGGYLASPDYEPGYGVQEIWFDPDRFMKLIDEHQATDVAGVPTMLAMLLNHPTCDQYKLTSLKVASIGAAPLSVDLARQFAERTGCRIRQIYGMTENTGIGAGDRISRPYRPGSTGPAYDDMQLRVVDDNGNDMPPGQSGEIVTRGPSTMKGYFKQAEETAKTIRGGWLHTGDIGYLDADGYLFVVDRKKDMIIKGGENIFPAEIENALYEHPDVAEAAAVGAPDAKYGEIVVAYVVPRGDAIPNEQDLIDHVKTQITPFKAPSRIHFIQALPKSGVGKILRRELREMAKDGS